MLTCLKKQFTGRFTCVYDRPYRLCGSWEATLISLTRSNVPVYVLCDLIDYTEINQSKIQLLDFFFSEKGIKSDGRTPYVNVLHKRFNTINIDVKTQLGDEIQGEAELKKIFATTDDGDEVTCLIHFRRIG